MLTIILDNEDSAEQIRRVLSAAAREVCIASSSLGVHEGKAVKVWLAERIYLRNTTNYFLFFFFAQGGKTPYGLILLILSDGAGDNNVTTSK